MLQAMARLLAKIPTQVGVIRNQTVNSERRGQNAVPATACARLQRLKRPLLLMILQFSISTPRKLPKDTIRMIVRI